RWDISCHSTGMSVVKNGTYAGYTLAQLIAAKKGELVGTRVSAEVFPLLVKVINSREKLSVQVHPDDDYALLVEKQLGKEEIWYVIDAQPGATLTLGVKDNCTKPELAAALAEGRIEEKLNQVAVKKGDVYHIPCGMIHAIGPGIVLLEVQQSSDVTYRLFDYGRDRELHTAKALDVLELHPPAEQRAASRREQGCLITRYCESRKLILELVEIPAGCGCTSDPERFHIYTCVEGRG
ncbi:type I phosphomannose isomerase catalytic subunit, partial [Acetonema longum]